MNNGVNYLMSVHREENANRFAIKIKSILGCSGRVVISLARATRLFFAYISDNGN